MKIETDASFYTSVDGFQRSSAIKTFESCSWSYYCSYVLKVPQTDNQGSLMGNVCHSFFECLLNPRHKHFFKKITSIGSVRACKETEKLVRRLIKKNKLPNDEKIFEKIDAMILVGLKTDFYVKGGKLVGKEYRFKIVNEKPYYKIYGTMDKIALKGKYVIIDDFKSSKLKYSGEDKESGIQALLYSLACRKLWPGFKPRVRFVFLQFPDEPLQEVEFTDEVLDGFEYYLEETQKKLDIFTERDAFLNFAADHPIPADGHFGGRLSCGFAKRPGQIKKDGTPMWACSYKFPFNYYAVKKDGKIIKTSKDRGELKLNDGEVIEEIHYEGCPRYRDTIATIVDTKINKFKAINVLDDF